MNEITKVMPGKLNITTGQAARWLRVDRRRIVRMLERGELQGIKVPGVHAHTVRWKVDMDSCQKWLNYNICQKCKEWFESPLA